MTQYQQAITDFVARLRQAHRGAGAPAHRRLAADMGYSVATVTRAFRTDGPPSWKVVTAMLTALGVPEDRIGGPWRRAWTDMMDVVDPITAPTVPARVIGLRAQEPVECDLCGALVADRERHTRFHREFAPRAALAG
ncbi:helix-turn-helix domain-containing protein [Actinokineospora enzanensis]|uniref:helix-turn-helix domain-containing protein n=1 Tax=Actinokineospora enzanensis TaxID=155975 RepID=UPI0003798458|nr:helix-turn-helix domain-containing protein [Actinokineospora enzanensis]